MQDKDRIAEVEAAEWEWNIDRAYCYGKAKAIIDGAIRDLETGRSIELALEYLKRGRNELDEADEVRNARFKAVGNA